MKSTNVNTTPSAYAKMWMLVCIGILAIGAALVLFFQAVTPPSQALDSPELQEKETSKLIPQPANEASSDSAAFKTVSKTQTPTGTVYIVTKDGITKTAIIPESIHLTPEQLEQFAFPPPISHLPRPGQETLASELVFYGMAVDEETNPVVNVEIKADVMIISPTEKQHREIVSTTSDIKGQFTFQIPWGQQMMLSFNAGTNHINPPAERFQYGPVGSLPIHHPDPYNPVVFVFQTLKLPEMLFSFEKRFRAPRDGSPVRIDLSVGQAVHTGGDLIVSIYCPEPYTETKDFPWSFKVEVVNGGLVEVGNADTRMEYLHEAPRSGYAIDLMREFGPDTTVYRRQYNGWYYVSSRNQSVYSKMYFDVNAFWDERGVPFGIRAVVNTNGSRYLHTEP